MENLQDTSVHANEGEVIGRKRMNALKKELFFLISYVAKNAGADSALEWINKSKDRNVEPKAKKLFLPLLPVIAVHIFSHVGRTVAQIAVRQVIQKVVQKGVQKIVTETGKHIVKEATKKVVQESVKETIKKGVKEKVKDVVKDKVKKKVKDTVKEKVKKKVKKEIKKEVKENIKDELKETGSPEYVYTYETTTTSSEEETTSGEGGPKQKLSLSSNAVTTFSLTVIETVAISLVLDSVEGKLPKLPDDDSGSSRQSQFTIQYYFDVKSYDSLVEYRLRLAMNKIEQASCINFESVLVDSEREDISKTLLRVTNPNNLRECSHAPVVDKYANTIQLVLGIDCLQERQILHSLLHALGFNDEVTHPKRDHYVRVMWDNIQPKYRKLFRIKVNEIFALHQIEYDPLSVMNFDEMAFSSNGRPTILPLIPIDPGYPSNELSALDKLKLRITFGSVCTYRKLMDYMGSCKVLMANDKKNEDKENNDDYDNNYDGGNDIDGEEEPGGKVPDHPQQYSKSEDVGIDKNKLENSEVLQEDNLSSSGPEIVSPTKDK